MRTRSGAARQHEPNEVARNRQSAPQRLCMDGRPLFVRRRDSAGAPAPPTTSDSGPHLPHRPRHRFRERSPNHHRAPLGSAERARMRRVSGNRQAVPPAPPPSAPKQDGRQLQQRPGREPGGGPIFLPLRSAPGWHPDSSGLQYTQRGRLRIMAGFLPPTSPLPVPSACKCTEHGNDPLLVQFVRMRNRAMSETTRTG